MFDDIIHQDIIVAPHTIYTTDTNDLRDAVAHPLVDYNFADTDRCKFVKPRAYELMKISMKSCFARQMSTTCESIDAKQSGQIQQQLNSIIRAGLDIDDIGLEALAFTIVDLSLLRLWSLVKSIKDDMLFLMRNNGPKFFIGRKQCGAKVMSAPMNMACLS